MKTVLFIFLAAVSSTIVSCSKSSSSNVQNIDFAANPAQFTITVDSIADSTNSTSTYYIQQNSVLLDYYRSLCEQKNVYLQDVSSVTLTSATLSITNPTSETFKNFKSVQLQTYWSSFGYTVMTNTDSSTTGSIILSGTGVNLLQYFNLHDLDTRFYFGKNDSIFHPMTMNVALAFDVKAKTH